MGRGAQGPFWSDLAGTLYLSGTSHSLCALVASRRCHMIHGFVVPRSRLAFSQLSVDGEAFAKKYINDKVTVYEAG